MIPARLTPPAIALAAPFVPLALFTTHALAAEPLTDRLWRASGAFHPMVVHFPIALLVVAVIFEFARRRGGEHRPGPTAFACLCLGAAGALLAALLGWSSAQSANYGGSAAWTLGVHRWAGIAAAVLAAVAVLAATIARGLNGPRLFNVYRVSLLACVLAVTVAGHHGGTLVHGEGVVRDALAIARGHSPPRASTRTLNAQQRPGDETPGDTYATRIEPIFVTRCYQCHTGASPEAGFRLATREQALTPGVSGKPTIVPGDASASLLYQLVSATDHDRRMPPKGSPLSREQVSDIAAWINAGAPWHGQRPAGEHWHWAYRAPVRPNPPPVLDTTWPRGPIDHFILARIESAGLSPSPQADRHALIRRLSLDLIGLPPSPPEVTAFLSDTRPGAYERLVDRLLASPHFGERWARVWLDLARYADSHGYEKDGPRVMWPYRDWVIDALNDDLPFDRFTIEQLAGDLLPDPTGPQLVATGFNRNTQTNEEGGTDVEEFRIDAVIDRVNTVGAVWLGSTVGCAQCHDHKNDPLTQRDYFRLLAIFNQDELDVHVVSSTEKYAAGAMIEYPRAARFDELADLNAGLARADADLARHAADLQPAAIGLATGRHAALPGFTPDHATALSLAHSHREQLSRQRSSLIAARALVMRRSPEPRQTRLFDGGSFLSPTEPVEPGLPAFLPPATDREPMDRLAFARWLVEPDNPLTARVTVNRIWETIFGRGIVETSEDFGPQGDPPTHPELLDHLAAELVRDGWSLKHAIRSIVTSATYRQSSRVTPDHLEKDPLNILLARSPRYRVEAEMVRDIGLTASGLLHRAIGGPSVFPPQPEGTWTQIYSGEQWVESQGPDRYRRGLYTFIRRTSPHPSMVAFDAPSREITCTRRPRTSTPLQALTTLNDPAFVEMAAALARRAIDEGGNDPRSRAAYAMKLCLAREPTPREIERLLALYQDQLNAYESDRSAAGQVASYGPAGAGGLHDHAQIAAWTIVANVLLNLDETLTRP
ncbi:MAG: DUF1553 domain-containing protein [Phycisphaeraceae bacterium]|nr:DUF1553 domain-containing protein [Phycisphaeraceae bacterium]